MYASTTILNALIARNPGRTSLGYVKLVYLVQGWSLAFDRPVVSDMPSLYEFGPVHAAAYDALRGFGGGTITNPVAVPGARTPCTVPETDVETIALLDEVLKVYGPLSDIQLSNLCHAEGTPWRIVNRSSDWKRRAGGLLAEVEIHAHFSTRLREHRESQERERAAIEVLAPQPIAA